MTRALLTGCLIGLGLCVGYALATWRRKPEPSGWHGGGPMVYDQQQLWALYAAERDRLGEAHPAMDDLKRWCRERGLKL